jgi:hypothetical protein
MEKVKFMLLHRWYWIPLTLYEICAKDYNISKIELANITEVIT